MLRENVLQLDARVEVGDEVRFHVFEGFLIVLRLLHEFQADCLVHASGLSHSRIGSPPARLKRAKKVVDVGLDAGRAHAGDVAQAGMVKLGMYAAVVEPEAEVLPKQGYALVTDQGNEYVLGVGGRYDKVPELGADEALGVVFGKTGPIGRIGRDVVGH